MPLRISTFDLLARRTIVLEKGCISQAVTASCAVPLLFPPTFIGSRPHYDGGIADHDAFAGCKAGERVLSIQHAAKEVVAVDELDDDAGSRLGRAVSLPAGGAAQGLKERLMHACMPRHSPPQDCVVLTLEHLPYVGPDRMHLGGRALDEASEGTQVAIDMRLAAHPAGGKPPVMLRVACASAPAGMVSESSAARQTLR